MAVPYPGGNPGVYPVDFSTPVGQLRAIVSDTNSHPYDPAEPGYQNFTLFSDAELEAYIALSPGNLYRAAGNAYLALAAQAALHASSIKDHDLAVDNRARGEQLTAIANMFFGKADDQDSASEDAFVPFELGGRGKFIPEGTLPQWGRRYTWGRWR